MATSMAATLIPSSSSPNRNTTDRLNALANPRMRTHTLSRSSSIRSISSAVSSEHSFYTASEEELILFSDDSQAMQSKVTIDTPMKQLSSPVDDEKLERTIEEERLSSGIDSVLHNRIKHDWLESSAFASRTCSGYGYTSVGGQSTTDTEPEIGDDRRFSRAEETRDRKHDYEEEWPVAYLTTLKKELGGESARKNSWKRNFIRVASMGSNAEERVAKTKESGQDSEKEIKKSKKTRKLKKKRPTSESVDIRSPHMNKTSSENERAFREEDNFVTSEIADQKQEPLDGPTFVANGHYPDVEIEKDACDKPENENILSNEGQCEVNSKDGYDGGGEYANDQLDCRGIEQEIEEAIMFAQVLSERPNTRTPQEILKGLEVVHEVEEEEDGNELHEGKVIQDKESERKGSYPDIREKGKRRASAENVIAGRLLDEMLREQSNASQNELEPEATATGIGFKGPERLKEPSTLPRSSFTRTRRNKLSKRPSRRVSQHERKTSKAKPSVKSSSKRESIVSLRSHPTPKSVMSSLRLGFLRSFASVALVFGIDVGSRRLSRELQTPNILVIGRHFSEKHLPRFPSRLDGVRSVDKKVAKYS